MPAGSRGARWLQVRPGELAPIALLFGWYFCVIGAAFIGRAVRDALFLAHLGKGALPPMYVVSPLALTVVGILYARVEGRLRRDRVVIATAFVSALAMLGARFAIGTGDWIYYALYVAVNVMSGLIIMQLWTVASDRYTSRDAKRLFGLIGAGGTAADVVIGAVISLLTPVVGAANLLFVCAGLLATAGALAIALNRIAGRVDAKPKPSRKTAAPEGRPPGASHLTLVGAALVCAVAVTTLVEFQWKAITGVRFGTDAAAMSVYYGYMSVATGVVSLLIQLVATRWTLQRLGVAGALLILPLGLGLGEVGLFLVPGIVAATALKMSDETFRFTVNDAASQLLFLPVPSRVRGRWKAIVDSAWKPGAQLGLGLLLLLYRAVAPDQVTPLVGIALGVIVIWVLVIARLRGAYLRSLRETLRRRPAALDGGLDAPWRADLGSGGAGSPVAVGGAAMPSEEVAALRGALAGDDPVQVLAALELARPREADGAGALTPLIAPLCAHADPAIRRAACAALAGTDDAAARAQLRSALGDPDDGVATAALAALLAGSIEGPAGVDDAARDARGKLGELCRSADARVRVRAAEALAAAGEPSALPGATIDGGAELARLLLDPDPVVVRAAVGAAAAVGSPALVGILLARLPPDPALADALAACGIGAEARIAVALNDPAVPVRARREVARALGVLATPEAIGALLDHVERGEPLGDGELRTAAMRAIARAGRTQLLGAGERARVRAVIDAELRVAYRALAAAEGLGRVETAANPDGSRAALPFLPGAPEGAAALLSTSLRDRQDVAKARVLLLLEAMYPAAGIDTLAANLREPDPARRANATEVLDSILDRELRARILPLVDESPRYAKLAAIGPIYPLPKLGPAEWIAELLTDRQPWLLACAAYYAGVIGIVPVADRLAELATHADDTVREAAVVALASLARA